MFKKIGLAIIAAVMSASLFAAVVSADPSNSRAVIGADLNDEQITKVYGYFGIERGSVTELSVANEEERKYLSWIIPEEQLGTYSISCVYIEILDEDSGITVSTHNIDWCTSEMYEGALLTAGIYDADIVVAAPFEVSGTAGLMGIYKAYEDITGTSLDELSKNAGLEELFVTGSLSEFIGSDNATHIIAELKLILDETQNMSDAELDAEIKSIAQAQNIELTDENITQIRSLARTLEGLDVDELQKRLVQLSQGFDQVKDTADGIKSFFESVGSFFDPVGNFFDKIAEWFSNLFS
jgi:uncharacterized protein YpuA (DUF1002 family)